MQISLDPELHRLARDKAAKLGVSFSKYVRTLIARDLGRRHRRSDPLVLFNLGDSGGSDVGRHKDAMVGEAIPDERRRGRRCR